MSLVADAIPFKSENYNFQKSYIKGKIKEDVLNEIIYDLDNTEIVSIIFLMTDQNSNIDQVIKVVKETSSNKLIELTNGSDWQVKLLEILIIIRNYNIIRKLGFTEAEINSVKLQFACNVHNVTPNLNRAVKSLYFLCEYLNKNEVDKLITEVNKSLDAPLKQNESHTYLEYYILHWLKEKYITINESNPNLNDLIKTLKNIGLLDDLPFNFDCWSITKKNEHDSIQIIKNDNSLQYNNQSEDIHKYSRTLWAEGHTKLCVIINEINFIDNIKYKRRLGSDLDEKNLKNAFEGCNFEVQIYQDLTKEEMMIFLDSLNEAPYNTYGSIFICILSHGYEGTVVFSDGETIATKVIEEKFCCKNLQRVFKFVILQSCQGKQIGFFDRKSGTDDSTLVTDGPSCPIYHMHFGLFQATLNDFAAMRNESKGTWFIQDICDELKMSTPITVKEWVQGVTKRLSTRRNKSKYYNKDIVQVPRFISSMSADYILPRYQGIV